MPKFAFSAVSSGVGCCSSPVGVSVEEVNVNPCHPLVAELDVTRAPTVVLDRWCVSANLRQDVQCDGVGLSFGEDSGLRRADGGTVADGENVRNL